MKRGAIAAANGLSLFLRGLRFQPGNWRLLTIQLSGWHSVSVFRTRNNEDEKDRELDTELMNTDTKVLLSTFRRVIAL